MSAVAHLRHARTFDSLRKHHNYRLYFAGQIVSITGTWVQSVAQAWLIVELTHSPVAVGFLALCQFGPFALFGLLGGVVSNHLDNRRTLMATQSASMVFAGALAVLARLLLMDESQLHRVRRAKQRPTLFRGLVEGLAYARHTPVVRLVILLM